MLRRKVTDRLREWKNSSNKALLVTGARQIGKSYAIREFGRSNYDVYFEVNLFLDADSRSLLIEATNASDFISRIAMLCPQTLKEGSTLIFIDEIQEFPQIVTLIKALVMDGRFSFVFSGSMLGTEFKGIASFPVGYVERIIMRPMDFEEFCWAVGVSKEALAGIRERFIAREPVESYVHEAMRRNFRSYLITGGMPEVVQDYIDSSYSLIRTRQIQMELVDQYKIDIAKYAGNRAFAVRSIFDRLPFELEGQNHRFVLSSLKDGARIDEYAEDFLWLSKAGAGLVVPRATEAKSPLLRTQSASYFKLYESDTGMLVSRYPQSAARAIYLERKTANLGGVVENVVSQELAAKNIPAWYYYDTAVGEVDFMIEGRGGRVVPIEVKSGAKFRSHAALDKLMDKPGLGIPEAVVLCKENLFKEGRVTYVPWYMVFCLEELTEKEEEAEGFFFAPVAL